MKPFDWIRGTQVGGRSLIWGRQTYRWSDLDFEANLKDGGSAGAGLNEGILYLMARPYIAMLLFGILYYFQKRSKQSI